MFSCLGTEVPRITLTEVDQTSNRGEPNKEPNKHNRESGNLGTYIAIHHAVGTVICFVAYPDDLWSTGQLPVFRVPLYDNLHE